jgi:hypothetical protein
MRRGKGAPPSVARVLDDNEALEMRRRGKSYHEIGAALGCNESSARRRIAKRMEVLRAETHEHAEEIRQMEVLRLDAMTDGIWDRAVGGDEKAIREVVRIMERKAKMLGLDKGEDDDGALLINGVRFVRATTTSTEPPAP